MMLSRAKPIITLLFLSPMIAELLSGSIPPLYFFNPISLMFFLMFYGCGALLSRELIVRWDKGKASLLLLGAAYGVWEEGVSVKSFFDPNWVDLGILGSFGRWLGVNWLWMFELTVYHAVMSITIPIVIVEIIFPEDRHFSWIGKKGMIVATSAFLFSTIVLNLGLTKYQPAPIYYLLCFVLIGFFIYLAYRLPKDFTPDTSRIPRYRNLWGFGFAWSLSWYLIFWVGPYILPSPPLIAIIAALQLFLSYTYLRGIDWRSIDDKHYLALVFGVLTTNILFAPIIELNNASTPENTSGMTLVGLAFLIFFLYLWRRTGEG